MIDLTPFLHPLLIIFLLLLGVPATVWGILKEKPGIERYFIVQQSWMVWWSVCLVWLAIWALPATLHLAIVVAYWAWLIWWVFSYPQRRKQASIDHGPPDSGNAWIPVFVALPISSLLLFLVARTAAFAPDTAALNKPSLEALTFYALLVVFVLWSKFAVTKATRDALFAQADTASTKGVLAFVGAVVVMLYWGKHLTDIGTTFEELDWWAYVTGISIVVWVLARAAAPGLVGLVGPWVFAFPCLAIAGVMVAISYPGP